MASSVGIQHQQGPVESEADIVRSCFRAPSYRDPISDGEEISVYKYVISSAAMSSTTDEPWVDGEVFCYMKWRKDWSQTGVKVKFYVLGPEYNLEAKKKEVYVWADEMMKVPGLPNLLTPLFATYNAHVKRVVVCYPFFDLQLKDWLRGNRIAAGEVNLSPIWNNLIRAVLEGIPTLEKMQVKGLRDESSFVWVGQPKEIKLVLLPEDQNLDGSYYSRLAWFLKCCLYNNWKNLDVLSFITLLERHPAVDLQCIINHPLLQDLDAVSDLIRTTWRSPSSLSTVQMAQLNHTIITTKWGNTSTWQVLVIQDQILMDLLVGRSNDAIGLFTYVKEISAHYNERRRKLVGQLGEHPVSRIKRCFPGLICDIYELSLDPTWLKKV